MAKPLLFITGFLGAGKTTLLRALLENLRELGRTADVILNDFENAEIDASALRDRTASIFPIAASCACCGSLDELVKLCLAAQKTKGDVLLIELNGTADPLPLLETFTLMEHQLPFSPRWQVGLVDSRHWGKRDAYAPLEQRQIETATQWMPTHAEGLTGAEVDCISESVSELNPYATRIDARRLAADLVGAGSTVEDNQSTAVSSNSSKGEISRRGHALSHRFTGYQIPMPGRHRRDQVTELMEALPDSVMRAKALVELKEAPGSRWLFQRTGRHPVELPQEVSGLSQVPGSLVRIGPCLAPEELKAVVNRHSGTESSSSPQWQD